jgi:F0F1-type ATP synthase delta subunit
MANIFTDLNKLVNTVQKVDKLLTEKPKRKRTKLITKQFTEEEFELLQNMIRVYHSNYYFRMTEKELKVYNKFK